MRDGDAVQRRARARFAASTATVRGLIHGAGVLADRRIVDQTDAQFDLVYDTKVKGLAHLFEAIDPESLRVSGPLLVIDGPVRPLGPGGLRGRQRIPQQVGPATVGPAAALSRRLLQLGPLGRRHGQRRAQAALRERRAVADPARRRCAAGRRGRSADGGRGPVEIVVLAEPTAADRAAAQRPPTRARPRRPAARPRSSRPSSAAAVDLESLPVLASHVIDGHAVLPMAIILEWLAEGAVHRNPGLVVCGLDDVRLFKGVILERPPAGDGRGPGRARRSAATVSSSCRSSCEARWPTAARSLTRGPTSSWPIATRPALRRTRAATLLPYPIARDEIYQTVLFHGPAMQGIERVEGWASGRSRAGSSTVAGAVRSGSSGRCGAPG